MTPRKVERDLYFTQRTLGDLRVAARGPLPLARRVAKRVTHRTVIRTLKRWGLW